MEKSVPWRTDVSPVEANVYCIRQKFDFLFIELTMKSIRTLQKTSGTLVYGVLLTEEEVRNIWPNAGSDDDIQYIGNYLYLGEFVLVPWGCCYFDKHKKKGNPTFALGISLGEISASYAKQKPLDMPMPIELMALDKFLKKLNVRKEATLFAVPTGCYNCT